MIMGIWRDLTAFVLLAHLVTLSRGNIEERRALEEILARNVSIVVIENKDDGPVDLEKLRNATFGYENSTVASNATGGSVDEDELVAELEEALVGAASSGQVIMIAPPVDTTDRGNSNKSAMMPGPVLVIETPASDKSKSLVNEAAGRKKKKSKATSRSLDQEVAQSQTRERSRPDDYTTDDEDLETLGDLLAITEYEPQRIDAKRIEQEIPKLTSDQPNSTLESTRHERPEDTHYDVPKRRNLPRKYQGTLSNIDPSVAASLNKSSSDSSIQEPLKAAAASESRSFPTDRRGTVSNPHARPNSNYTEIIRGPRNTEIIIPLTTNPTSSAAPARKLTYNEITRKNGLIGTPGSTIDTTTSSTFAPAGFSGSTETRHGNVNNFTISSNRRVPTTPVVSLHSTYYPFLHQQTSSLTGKTASQPSLPTSAVPRASRRSDDYYSAPDYVTSTNDEALQEPLTNQPLGYLTRYNQPSLVARQVPKVTRSYPAASLDYAGRTGTDDSHDVTSPGRSRTVPVRDQYENTRLRFSGSRTTSRPPFVDYRQVYQRENLRHQPTSDYQEVHQGTTRQQQPAVHQRHQPTSDYREVHQGTTQQQQPAVHQRHQPTVEHRNEVARTTPSYESYEEDSEEDSTAAQKSEEVRRPQATSQAINGLYYPRSKNSPVTSTTVPAYTSYEDEENPEPHHHHQRFTTVGQQQRQRLTTTTTTTSPYVVPTRSVQFRSDQPYDYFARTSRPVTPTSLVDNPIYQLHGIKTSSGRVAGNAIREPSKDQEERRPTTTAVAPLDGQTTRFPHHRTAAASQRIVSTTPASDSHEFSEDKRRLATTHRLRNPNYVDHRSESDKPTARNVYNDRHNEAAVAPAYQMRKHHKEYAYDEPISNRYLKYRTKPVSQSPSHAPFNPERNSDLAAGRVTKPSSSRNSSSSYVDHSDSNEDDSNDERRYIPAATKLRALNHRANLELKHSAAQTTRAPSYQSYEEDEDDDEEEEGEDNVSPSGSEKLIESHTANYGNRVRPRVVVADEGRRTKGENVDTNYSGRRRDSDGHGEDEEEPVESVDRADVEEAPYEDEPVLLASSGHAEDQATHQTHARAKKHGGAGAGGGEHKHEEGGGLKHEEDHHESHGEKGDKGYKGYHEYDKGKKGHHDKEDHDKEYDEKKGEKKKHEEEGGYHKEHHHGEKGDKEAEFAEKGEHQKGHSTKGQHVVHKKDEYEKKTEFYDESHEEDGDEKEGEYHHEHEHKKGGHEKKGHHDSGHHEDKYGEKGEHEKGHHYHEKKGHDGKDGKDQHHEHHEKYGKKGGHEEGLKWSHKKGDDGHGGGKKKGS